MIGDQIISMSGRRASKKEGLPIFYHVTEADEESESGHSESPSSEEEKSGVPKRKNRINSCFIAATDSEEVETKKSTSEMYLTNILRREMKPPELVSMKLKHEIASLELLKFLHLVMD